MFELNAQGAWRVGLALVLLGFASGALLGLGFQRDEFLGGYTSWRRRLLRLGHIACIALGMLQMLCANSSAASASGSLATACWLCWRVGAIAMPLVCWSSAFVPRLRHLFALPVISLASAAALTLWLSMERGGTQL